MKIVIADQMEEDAVKNIGMLGEVVYKPANLQNEIEDADVLIVRSATNVTRELISKTKKLKIVARAGVGLDNVDQEACIDRGIKIINTPGASTNAVAELTVGLIIGVLRNIPKANQQMKNNKWDKKNLLGQEIEGKTLGIIGYGRIGAAVAKKASALGMKIIAYNPPPRHEDGLVTFIDNLEAFLGHSDVISIHAALTESTKNIINSDTIAKMKDGVFLVNTARGEMIDEDALYEAVKRGKIAAVAMDVYREEPYRGKLTELDNVFMTPHLGASTREAQARISSELVKTLSVELKK